MENDLVPIHVRDLSDISDAADRYNLWIAVNKLLIPFFDHLPGKFVRAELSRGTVVRVRVYTDRDLCYAAPLDLTKEAWIEEIKQYITNRRKEYAPYDANPDENGLNRPLVPYDHASIDRLIYRELLGRNILICGKLNGGIVLDMSCNEWEWVTQIMISKEKLNKTYFPNTMLANMPPPEPNLNEARAGGQFQWRTVTWNAGRAETDATPATGGIRIVDAGTI